MQTMQKHYYDSKFHGIDWRARVQEARKNLETARSMDDAVSEIAALLDSLHDSHTFLLLPPRTHVHDFGFQMEMIGDRCYVVRVRAGGDAEKKGLKQGDDNSGASSSLLTVRRYAQNPLVIPLSAPGAPRIDNKWTPTRKQTS